MTTFASFNSCRYANLLLSRFLDVERLRGVPVGRKLQKSRSCYRFSYRKDRSNGFIGPRGIRLSGFSLLQPRETSLHLKPYSPLAIHFIQLQTLRVIKNGLKPHLHHFFLLESNVRYYISILFIDFVSISPLVRILNIELHTYVQK